MTRSRTKNKGKKRTLRKKTNEKKRTLRGKNKEKYSRNTKTKKQNKKNKKNKKSKKKINQRGGNCNDCLMLTLMIFIGLIYISVS